MSLQFKSACHAHHRNSPALPLSSFEVDIDVPAKAVAPPAPANIAPSSGASSGALAVTFSREGACWLLDGEPFFVRREVTLNVLGADEEGVSGFGVDGCPGVVV